MELYQLKTFAIVADTGNLSRAAEILHTSQPAVSAQIKALEHEFGIILFKRTGKGVLLTENGQKIKDKIENILKAGKELEYFLQNLSHQVRLELKIGLNTDSSVLKLKELLEFAAQKAPQLQLHFIQSTSADILSNLKKGLMDGGFIFGGRQSTEVETVFLQEIKLVIALPFAWKDKTTQASIIDIIGLPWVLPPNNCPFYLKVNDLFEKHGLKPSQFVSSDDETTIRQLVQSGIGVSLLPEYICRLPAQRKELIVYEREKWKIDLSFAYLKNKKNNPGVKLFIGLLKRLWEL
jgi:DNA-binding transcriptional LysR family regulator